MSLVISRNNLNLSLKVLYLSDSVEEFYDKVQYNFDQILINGGGEKGSRGDTGPRGWIGATGSGRKGDKGDKGSRIHYVSSNLVDGSIVSNPLHKLEDTIIDLNGDFFEVTGTPPNLFYTLQFSLSSLSASSYWEEQTIYQAIGSNPITSNVLFLSAPNIITAVRLVGIGTDTSQYRRILIGLDRYVGAINNSLNICNILIDPSDTPTDISQVSQIALRFRPNHSSNPVASSANIRFFGNATDGLLSLDNVNAKIYLQHTAALGTTFVKSKTLVLFNDPDLTSIGTTNLYKLTVEPNKITEDFVSEKITKAVDPNAIWKVQNKDTVFEDTIITNRYLNEPELGTVVGGVLDISNLKTENIIISPSGGSTTVTINRITGGRLNQIVNLLFRGTTNFDSFLILEEDTGLANHILLQGGRKMTTYRNDQSVKLIIEATNARILQDVQQKTNQFINLNKLKPAVWNIASPKLQDLIPTNGYEPGCYGLILSNGATWFNRTYHNTLNVSESPAVMQTNAEYNDNYNRTGGASALVIDALPPFTSNPMNIGSKSIITISNFVDTNKNGIYVQSNSAPLAQFQIFIELSYDKMDSSTSNRYVMQKCWNSYGETFIRYGFMFPSGMVWSNWKPYGVDLSPQLSSLNLQGGIKEFGMGNQFVKRCLLKRTFYGNSGGGNSLYFYDTGANMMRFRWHYVDNGIFNIASNAWTSGGPAWTVDGIMPNPNKIIKLETYAQEFVTYSTGKVMTKFIDGLESSISSNGGGLLLNNIGGTGSGPTSLWTGASFPTAPTNSFLITEFSKLADKHMFVNFIPLDLIQFDLYILITYIP